MSAISHRWPLSGYLQGGSLGAAQSRPIIQTYKFEIQTLNEAGWKRFSSILFFDERTFQWEARREPENQYRSPSSAQLLREEVFWRDAQRAYDREEPMKIAQMHLVGARNQSDGFNWIPVHRYAFGEARGEPERQGARPNQAFQAFANACGRKAEAIETLNLREARSSLYLQRGFISSDHFSVQTFHWTG